MKTKIFHPALRRELPKKTSVFISYAREDRDHAEKLAVALVSSGFDVWWDHLLFAGENYRAKIANQIEVADKVIVIWSKYSIISSFVIDEANRAVRLSKLIPLIIDSVDPPLVFGNIHSVVAETVEAGQIEIVSAIEGLQIDYGGRRNTFGNLNFLTKKGVKWTLLFSIIISSMVSIGIYYIIEYRYSHVDNMRYATYYSEAMKIRLRYPISRLMVDTTQETFDRIPLITSSRVQEVLVFRASLPDHRDIRRGQRDEKASLEALGHKINYVGPSNNSKWSNWFVLSGLKPNGNEFYYRRWYTNTDIVSVEFEYRQSDMELYNKIIEEMTLRDGLVFFQ